MSTTVKLTPTNKRLIRFAVKLGHIHNVLSVRS